MAKPLIEIIGVERAKEIMANVKEELGPHLEYLIRKKALELYREMTREKMPAGVVRVGESEFREGLEKHRVVVADFWAEWCLPCRMVAPIMERLAKKYAGRAYFVKVNVDECRELAIEHGIMSIPTVIVFLDGREYKRFVGVYPGLEKELDGILAELT